MITGTDKTRAMVKNMRSEGHESRAYYLEKLQYDYDDLKQQYKAVADLCRFMCQTWTHVDKFVYEHCSAESLATYPVIQGTRNQFRLNEIGEQPFDKVNIQKGVEVLLQIADEMVTNTPVEVSNSHHARIGGSAFEQNASHELKTDPEVFQASYDGKRDYEIRFNDRHYKVGDTLLLRETQYSGDEMKSGKPLIYTGRKMIRTICHVLRGYGLTDGWVILAVNPKEQVETLKRENTALKEAASDRTKDQYTSGLRKPYPENEPGKESVGNMFLTNRGVLEWVGVWLTPCQEGPWEPDDNADVKWFIDLNALEKDTETA